MASAAIQVTAYGVNGKPLPSPQDFVISSLYAVVLETTQSVAGASCTVRAIQGPGGNIYVNYNVSQTMSQVLDLLNLDTTSDLTVVNNLTVEGNIIDSVETGISAFAGGGQASATALTKDYNIVTTVATAADSVKLLTAAVGLVQTVKNLGANPLAVFPFSGDAINGAAADASVTIPVNATMTFVANSTSNWETKEEVLAPTSIYTDTINQKTANAVIAISGPYRVSGTPQTLTDTGAVNLTTYTTLLVTTGAATSTLAAGAEGQFKFIRMKTDGGDQVCTVTNLEGGTTITFNDAGDFVHLLYQDAKWNILTNSGCTVA